MDKTIPRVEGPEEGLFLRKHFLLFFIRKQSIQPTYTKYYKHKT